MKNNIEMPLAKQEQLEDENLPTIEEIEEILLTLKDSEFFDSEENRQRILLLIGQVIVREMETGEDHEEIVEALEVVEKDLETAEKTQDRFPKVQQKLSETLRFVQKKLGIKGTEEKE